MQAFSKNNFKLALLVVALGAGLTATQVRGQEPSSLTETYGTWMVQCRTEASGHEQEATKTCQMSQELRQSQSNERLMLFAIDITSDGVAQATIVAPFGLHLDAGLELRVDEADLASERFRTCMPIGCLSEFDLNEEYLDKLTSGELLTVAVHSTTTGQKIQVNMSLEGFASALTRLEGLG